MVSLGGGSGMIRGSFGGGVLSPCGCYKENSDGSEIDEDFSGSLTGWSNVGDSGTWKIVSGRLRWDSTIDDPSESLIYQASSNTDEPDKIIAQCTIWQQDSDTKRSGIEIGADTGTPSIGLGGSAEFALYADWENSRYHGRYQNGDVFLDAVNTPADGDTITIIAKRMLAASQTRVRICYYKNSTLLNEAERSATTWSDLTQFDHGMYIYTTGGHANELGEFDDYTMEIVVPDGAPA